MHFITITTWEVPSGTDFDLTLRDVREKRLPALQGFGATRVTVVRTSDRTAAINAEWPDKFTRDTAELKIDEVRRVAAKEERIRLTGEMRGEIVADL